jgi:putative transposase
MGRPLRIEYPGALYHITSRGNERKAIFLDDEDRERFLEILLDYRKRYGIPLHSYVLMDNHYHLILGTPQGNLLKVMHGINGRYTGFSTGNMQDRAIFFRADTRESWLTRTSISSR